LNFRSEIPKIISSSTLLKCCRCHKDSYRGVSKGILCKAKECATWLS